jgi:hypothetical protein
MSLRRREFIAGLGGGAAVQLFGAYGQAPKLPVIGVLSDGPPRLLATYIAAFRDGIIALGYVASLAMKASRIASEILSQISGRPSEADSLVKVDL